MPKPYAEHATREARIAWRARPPAERGLGGSDAEPCYGIGKLQYHFLVANGLRHNHRFLDMACGSLRLGQYLIPFLDEGNYRGIEGEKGLGDAGLGDRERARGA